MNRQCLPKKNNLDRICPNYFSLVQYDPQLTVKKNIVDLLKLKLTTMKNYLLLFVSLILFNSCENDKISVIHPDFEKNKEIAIKFIELHNSENLEAQAELIHEDLDWAPPMYGSENYGKADHIEAMKMYHTMFDNIKFQADYWLPGVDPETGMNDGSVRTYGTWTGVHTETGKDFVLKAYHPMAFKDGQIIGGGDYFDFGCFMASFQE